MDLRGVGAWDLQVLAVCIRARSRKVEGSSGRAGRVEAVKTHLDADLVKSILLVHLQVLRDGIGSSDIHGKLCTQG